ncbi:MAG: DUF1460 domain-containing protein [Chitinispirillia bacterium]|nr:DUF1460 domain-containing protein [Chitinispirillia bacterium]
MIKQIAVLFFIVLFSLSIPAQNRTLASSQIVYTEQDSLLLVKLLNEFKERGNLRTGKLMAEMGKKLLGNPYPDNIPITLGGKPPADTGVINTEEKLIVEFRTLDCVTFVENCLAMARTVKSGNPTFGQFIIELEKNRYRGGKMDGYASRLHYFSDWIFDNTQRGLLSLPKVKCDQPIKFNIHFMTSRPDNYPVLKSNSEIRSQIASIEKTISDRRWRYIKNEDIAGCEDEFQEGDIVGLVTNVRGLDMIHAGILVRLNGRIHLLHASTTHKRVVITHAPLSDYLSTKKTITGMIAARPELK